ncbi:uncharacterized protein [Pempheris klunzingeri]|uniref:uncharacterized protein n=1 Tax=Pempheris klunzingeri TaxID=3127111 RepID=UPI00397F021A
MTVTPAQTTAISHSTFPIITVSNTTVTVTALPTTPQCRDNDCHGCVRGTCKFNLTLGRCHCHCQEHVFGDLCDIGENNTSPHIDTGAIPTRKANFTLEIQVHFEEAFQDLNSSQSLEFISKLEQQLEALCREADPLSFYNVQVIKLSEGSVVAESMAEYIYTNNETQIQFVNTQLDGVLTDILNDTSNLNKISQAFNDAPVQLNGLTFQPPEIKNITDMEQFVNCTQFAKYTAEIVDEQWQCVGPCKANPDYCHQHGECHNNIHKGPICRCFESSLKQFHGPQCDLFLWGPGFYGALFGSLAAAFLIFIFIVIAVIVKKRRTGVWKRSNSYNRRLSAFEEDFFDFSDRGHNKTSRGF